MEIKTVNIDSRFEFAHQLLDKYITMNNLTTSDLVKLKEDFGSSNDNYFSYLFNNLSELAFVVNKKGDIISWNSQVKDEFVRIPSKGWNINRYFSEDFESTFMLYAQNYPIKESIEFSDDMRVPNKEVLPVDICVAKFNSISDCYLILVSNRVESEALLKKVVEVQEKERSRLAVDIHDSIGQQLTAVKLYLNTAVSKINSKDLVPVTKATKAMDATIADMRNICFNLLPKSLENQGIERALKEYFKKTRNGYRIDFKWAIAEDLPTFKKDFEVAIFRMFQEFLSNSIKHGKASVLLFVMGVKNDEFKMQFQDNGVGFNLADEIEYGMGIKNISTRTQLFKGNVNIASTPEKGTTYNFSFKLKSIVE